MAYDGRIMRRAVQKFEEDRREREEQFQTRREAIFRRQPRLRQIEAELSGTASRIIAAAMRRGTDPLPAVEVLRDENLGLQAEKRRLLEQMGYPEDALEEKPRCPLCGDTGYRNGGVCRCLKQYYAREQQKELSRMLDLGTQSFETFSLDWYSETRNLRMGLSSRENMEWVYNTCRTYAETFTPGVSGNLLLMGGTGLGKTFLSAAIARVVSEKGCSVVYDTAGSIFRRFESQKFRREDGEEADADVERVLHCDLLILDDLGSELTTPFIQSALYELVNTRLITGKHTVISSNLSLRDIALRYSGQVSSRIAGEYRLLEFWGEDIRKLKNSSF